MVEPSYNVLSEKFRVVTPPNVICQVFCGGKGCKYEQSKWPPGAMAIKGIFSHWITEDLLAMSRPNTEMIERNDIVAQFIQQGIRTIINLQMPGEHAHCGPPLGPSGFSYEPELFMKNEIYFYNFTWKDYGQPTLTNLLNVIKVVAFAQSQGKVAVHCHAGLGRTGVLIACYLMYSKRLKAVPAIQWVRSKRPYSVQTKAQIEIVREFEHFLGPLLKVFCVREFVSRSLHKYHQPFTLQKHLKNQKEILHGYEGRALRYIPKILYVICERLLVLCGQQRGSVRHQLNYNITSQKRSFTRYFFCSRFDDEKSRSFRQRIHEGSAFAGKQEHLFVSDLTEDCGPNSAGARTVSAILEDLLDSDFSERDLLNGEGINDSEFSESLLNIDLALNKDKTQVPVEEIVKLFISNPDLHKAETLPIVKDYCLQLNGQHQAWVRLASESQPVTLIILLWSWLIHLKKPILSNDELTIVVTNSGNPIFCFAKFDQVTRYTVEYLLRFIYRLMDRNERQYLVDDQTAALRRLAGVLTHQAVEVNGVFYPIMGRAKRMSLTVLDRLLHFFQRTLEHIEETDSRSLARSLRSSDGQ